MTGLKEKLSAVISEGELKDKIMRIDPTAICITVVVFAMIFILILLNTWRIIRVSKPMETVKSLCW